MEDDDKWGDPLDPKNQAQIEVEVVDDPPEEKPAKTVKTSPREASNEDEPDDISERVQKRINKVVRQREEEREARQRESQEWQTEKAQLLDELNKTRKTARETTIAATDTYEKQLKDKLSLAKVSFGDAYDSGNKDKLLDAQTAIAEATAELKLLEATKARMPKEVKEDVADENDNNGRQPQRRPQKKPTYSQKAVDWADEHKSWWGKEGYEMEVAAALAVDNRLKVEGYDPESDEFYEEINKRLGKKFPDLFKEAEDEEVEVERPQRRKSQVMSGGRGSPGVVKVKLSRGQEEAARKLGVDLKTYSTHAKATETVDQNGYSTIPMVTRRR